MRKLFVIVAGFSILFSSCTSKYKKDIYVYKSTLKNDSVTLFVDDKEIGQIPYADANQVANETSDAMLFNIQKGKHKIIAKDNHGNCLSTIDIQIKGGDTNMGIVKYSRVTTITNIINNDERYTFKNRSKKQLFYVFVGTERTVKYCREIRSVDRLGASESSSFLVATDIK